MLSQKELEGKRKKKAETVPQWVRKINVSILRPFDNKTLHEALAANLPPPKYGLQELFAAEQDGPMFDCPDITEETRETTNLALRRWKRSWRATEPVAWLSSQACLLQER